MAPNLPEDALAALRQIQEDLAADSIEVGQMWWVPRRYLRWFPPPPKDRYCIVVALEATPGGTIVHLVAGTGNLSHDDGTLTVTAGNGVSKDTSFKFRFSGSIAATALAADGRRRSDPGLTSEQINAAAQAAGSAHLKGLCK